MVAFCALLGATLLVGVSPASATDPPTVTILVGDYYFCEPEFENDVCKTFIEPGDTVLWDFSPTGQFELHTATHCGDNCVNVTETPLFDSGVLNQSGTYKFTFDTPGQYLYYCAVHPVTMLGEINVGVEPPPTPEEPTSTPEASPPPPVGGISLQTGLTSLTAQEPNQSGVPLAMVVTAAAGAFLLLGSGWYAARRIFR